MNHADFTAVLLFWLGSDTKKSHITSKTSAFWMCNNPEIAVWKPQILDRLMRTAGATSYLQQAGTSREAQSQRLTADVESLRVGLLQAHRKWVARSGCVAAARHPEQSFRAQGQRGVGGLVEVVDGETQRREAHHERCLDEGSEN